MSGKRKQQSALTWCDKQERLDAALFRGAKRFLQLHPYLDKFKVKFGQTSITLQHRQFERQFRGRF